MATKADVMLEAKIIASYLMRDAGKSDKFNEKLVPRLHPEAGNVLGGIGSPQETIKLFVGAIPKNSRIILDNSPQLDKDLLTELPGVEAMVSGVLWTADALPEPFSFGFAKHHGAWKWIASIADVQIADVLDADNG